MATAALIPVEEYLHTNYDPDCDYVDGVVEERNLGERWHSAVQMMIGAIFLRNRQEWGLMPLPEQRVQVSARRYRVPDVCVVRTSDLFTPIVQTAPVLCVEVLSPEDRFDRVLVRVDDYLRMGVPAIWIVDPRSRRVWTVSAGTGPVAFAGEVLTLEGTAVQVPVAEMFVLLDEAGAGPVE